MSTQALLTQALSVGRLLYHVRQLACSSEMLASMDDV